MAQIIRFPVKAQAASSGYDNLSRLIAVAATKEVLNFYVESIEQLEKSGKLLDGEAQKLTEQGREKRLEMAKPDPIEKEVAEAPGVYRYTPEMGGQKPECQMEASRGYYGKHWFIDTPLELKGRGIELIKKYQEKDFPSLFLQFFYPTIANAPDCFMKIRTVYLFLSCLSAYSAMP